jgi:hypothetical protein
MLPKLLGLPCPDRPPQLFLRAESVAAFGSRSAQGGGDVGSVARPHLTANRVPIGTGGFGAKKNDELIDADSFSEIVRPRRKFRDN